MKLNDLIKEQYGLSELPEKTAYAMAYVPFQPENHKLPSFCMAGNQRCFEFKEADGSRIIEKFFGYDPVSHEIKSLSVFMLCFVFALK